MKVLLIADSMAEGFVLPSTDVRVFDSARTDDYAIRKLLRTLRNAQYDHIIFLIDGNDLKFWGGETETRKSGLSPVFQCFLLIARVLRTFFLM